MRLFTSKYFFTLIVFGFLISALPVAFIGIFSYKWSSGVVQKKVNAGNLQVLKQSQMRVEQALKIIDNSVLQFIVSQLVSHTSNRKLLMDDFSAINSMSDGLSHFDTGEIKIHESALVSINYGWVVTQAEYKSLDEYGGKEQWIQFASAPKNLFWTGDDKGYAYRKKEKYGYGVNLVRKLPHYDSTGMSDFVVVKVLSSEIAKLVADIAPLGEIKILDDRYRLIHDADEAMLGRDVASVSYIEEIQRNKSDSGQLNAVIRGNNYAVTFIKSGYNQWTYIFCVPVVSITREARSIGWVTFFTCVGILLMLSVIIYQGSKRIYSPVKNLYEAVKNTFGGEEQKKRIDELIYIDERVKNLMATQSQMAKQMKSQVEQLKELFVIKLLQGEMEEEEINDKLELLKYSKAWSWLCVLVLEIDTLEGTPFFEKDRDLVMFAVKNLINELIPAEQRLNPVLLKQMQITVIGSNHPAQEAFINFAIAQAEMIQNAVKEYLKVMVSIGLSRPYCGFGDICRAYREAEEAIRYKVRSSMESVVYIGNVKTVGPGRSNFPGELKDELLYAVRRADLPKAETTLHRLLEQIFEEKYPYPEYQVIMCRLFSELTGLLQDLGEPLQRLYGEQRSLLDKLFEHKTLPLVEKWMVNAILLPLVKLVEEHTKRQYRKISDEVIDMIRREYDRDLSLSLCAERLNYSPNYISKIFREETGVNFSEYLALFRLNIAKKWLKETEMKVSEIAEKLQYKNAENFIRYFKKLEGMTPGQYRDL